MQPSINMHSKYTAVGVWHAGMWSKTG